MSKIKNHIMTRQMAELLATRFFSMVTKFYYKKPNSNTMLKSGGSYVGAEFTSPDNKRCYFSVTLEYFKNNQQEVYDLLKNPFEIEKDGLICEFQ